LTISGTISDLQLGGDGQNWNYIRPSTCLRGHYLNYIRPSTCFWRSDLEL